MFTNAKFSYHGPVILTLTVYVNFAVVGSLFNIKQHNFSLKTILPMEQIL